KSDGSWRQVLGSDFQVLNEHSFDTGGAKIPVTDTKVANPEIAPVFRIGVIGFIEVPGCGITAIPKPVGGNLPGCRRSNSINLQHEIARTVDIKKHWLELVTDRQLKDKIGHGDAGATLAAILGTRVDGQLRGVEVQLE